MLCCASKALQHDQPFARRRFLESRSGRVFPELKLFLLDGSSHDARRGLGSCRRRALSNWQAHPNALGRDSASPACHT